MADVVPIEEMNARSAEVRRLRWEAMARGEFPEAMSPEEAAYFARRHVDTLLKSDAPRTHLPGRGKGKQRDAIFLKSQLLAWMLRYSTYDATETHRVGRHGRRLSA